MRRFLALALLLLGAASAASAQSVRVEVTLETGTNRPRVRTINLFDDPQWREAIAASYPIRLNYQLDLWSPRNFWFAENLNSRKWAFVITRQAVLDVYTLTTIIVGREPIVERFASLNDLRLRVEMPLPISGVGPNRDGTFWYSVKLGISTLSADEFREFERYLQGNSGGGGGGIGAALLRMALPKESVVGETSRFTIGGRE
ncbi:MAG: hypothetical protein SFU84_04550 [Gemmatimonadales bacterium]|nr:hypothetical protein [Gemmatimonadales bacterium]